MADNEVRRMIALPKSEVTTFEGRYGEGRLSWVLALLLTEFNKLGTLTPNDYAAIAAKVLNSKIDSV